MTEKFDTERTAVIAVDLQYECITGNGAWPICNPEQVLTKARKVIEAARHRRIPIIYTKHWLDPRGIDAMRHEPTDDRGRPLHSVAGDPMAEICEEVAPGPEDIVVHKQRWTGFYGTEMDVVLNRLDVAHLIMFGVWTEACFETTVWDALWRDNRITLVKDACGSATPLMHMTAILDLANWLYGGTVITADELVKAFGGEPYRAWRFSVPNSFAYTLENVQALYESL